MSDPDIFRGCLAGLEAGDVVGTAVEFMPSDCLSCQSMPATRLWRG